MKIRLIDYGYKHTPYRAHENDAGADVYLTDNVALQAHTSVKIPLGFGLELPDGCVGFVVPRSSLSSRGITCELAPVDSGYRGEIHAIVTNNTDGKIILKAEERVGQIVILPVIIADFVTEKGPERGTGAFGSTGK